MASKQRATTGASFRFEDTVPLGRIFLALENPRHEPVETESEAIERLCNAEEVYPLARDIVRHGLSPLERFALVPVETGRSTTPSPSYYVAEGNRRVCALKLLADPDLAPAKLRKHFERLAEQWTPIRSVPSVVFADEETLRVWLDRVHSGPQGGVGRRTWSPEQKQRFTGSTKNKLAQDVLDYAEAEGMITREERKGKLTTAQRFLTPEVFQEAIGIDRSDPDGLSRTRPKHEFDAMLRRFIRDLVEGKEVTSRKNKPEVIEYARKLASMPGISNVRVQAEPLVEVPTEAKKTRIRRKPRKPLKARHIQFDDGVFQALRSLGNHKLESLYYSICHLELEGHTPLICVGAWSFFETLTALQGRKDGTNFAAFLSKDKLERLGFTGKSVAIRAAIGRVHEHGNTTKHHAVSGTFNGEQLHNDMVTLREVILKCVAEASP